MKPLVPARDFIISGKFSKKKTILDQRKKQILIFKQK